MASRIDAAGALFQISCCLIILSNCFVDGGIPNATTQTFIPAATCGYQNCPEIKLNKLNVHLIPHTHNDLGWETTIDEYYIDVKKIIDSVVQELLKDPAKRFIYVESAFFFKWWAEQTPELQEQVKMLVNEGRLEFIGGAWSMNDEATTHYQSVIDQFTWGLRRLNDTFGECGRPRIGWQIDPFGHSREMASMFAQMGFDGLFFGRLDYQDKDNRQKAKTMEMIWHTSSNLDETTNLFTSVLYNQYQPPPGFCFDILCEDSIDDTPRSIYNNVMKQVNSFVEFAKRQASFYRTNNILITMGGDFTYQDANYSFTNLDKLIKYTNLYQPSINLLYSTPSCYLKSLHEAGITWPTKGDDFFPYASGPHAYWTGYFTSRPTLKRYEREGNHFLQVCKQLTALAPQNYSEFTPHLTYFRETMGIMQHHDAITGTARQHVTDNYAQLIDEAFNACGANTQAVLNGLATGKEPRSAPTKPEEHMSTNYTFDFESCPLLNISSCPISEENDQFILTLYNPLGRSTFEYVRIPVPDVNYVVKDYKDVTMEIQFVPIPDGVQQLSFRDSAAQYELIFLASDLPALGYKSYYISKTNDSRAKPQPELTKLYSPITIGNEHIMLSFDTKGFLYAVMVDGQSRVLNQDFFYYQSNNANSQPFSTPNSGAYVFRPLRNIVYATHKTSKLTVYRGPLVEEVHQVFNEWISQVVRVYRQSHYAEFEWLVGPIPVDDNKGKEIISRFTSDIQSKGVFYTDSNGREMIRRTRNHRDTWKLNLHEKIAGNYYPITTKIALEDKTMRMALLTDRAQGGSSLTDGALELMVHRRLLYDDLFGVYEPLNEKGYGYGLVARGKHYLVMGKSDWDQSPTTEAMERFTQLEKLLPTWKFFSEAQAVPYEEWREKYTNIFTGLSMSLPKQIHLLTFEPWRENEILIRFEHIFEQDEDPEFSKTAQFNLLDGLGSLKIADIRETTLAANNWIDKHRRLHFTEHGRIVPRYSLGYQHLRVRKPLIVTQPSYEDTSFANSQDNSSYAKRISQIWIGLEPMQIRTFVLTLMKPV